MSAMAEELSQIAERLEEIQDWALADGVLGAAHKIEEGVGRIWNAAIAAHQEGV